ncbi:MAG: membrane protein insertase YidC [Chloroflexi bacterium]|nr:membrane protein insertase YidC [Chloroflexota bacterium]
MEILSLLWNEIIFHPLLNGIVALYVLLGRNFGVAILVFTVVVRLLTLPLTLKQTRSTQKMMGLQPKLKALQQRYAKDRPRISQETMRLYKEAGVNPLGCLGPMLIQFPIWIGLYQAILQALPTDPESLVGLSQHLYSWLPLVHGAIPLNSRFLWLNLAEPDPTPVFPVLVGISMWVMQKMTTPPAADPRQQSTNTMLLWMMPIMFAFFTFSFASGLPVYWVASNVIGIVIQYFVTGWGGLLPSRARPAPVVVAASEGTAAAPLEKEASQDGHGGNERQDSGGGHRARPKGARRRARGGRRRGH